MENKDIVKYKRRDIFQRQISIQCDEPVLLKTTGYCVTCKPTGKRALGRPRRRWEDNIRMGLEEIGINAGNWVDSAQDRDYWRALVNAALNLRVPISHGVSYESCTFGISKLFLNSLRVEYGRPCWAL